MAWEPIEDDTATGEIGMGIHTGLRKAAMSTESGHAWRAINDMTSGEWNAVLRFCVEGLASMGYRLCKEVEE